MSRMYEYHESPYYGGNSMSSVDEYLDRINRMHRAPTMIDNFSSEAPRTHPPHHNSSAYAEKHSDRRVKTFHQAPEVVRKKVHFTEHEKHVEVERHGEREAYEEKTIDMEADGFIQKRHKNFESCNTFKGY